MTDRRLEGLEVVEICNAIAGPFAGRLLAENGANVTKVEPIDGADFRNRKMWYDPDGSEDFTYRFMAYNIGKDSVAIDLKDPDSRDVMLSLLEDADVFIDEPPRGRVGAARVRLDGSQRTEFRTYLLFHHWIRGVRAV